MKNPSLLRCVSLSMSVVHSILSPQSGLAAARTQCLNDTSATAHFLILLAKVLQISSFNLADIRVTSARGAAACAAAKAR